MKEGGRGEGDLSEYKGRRRGVRAVEGGGGCRFLACAETAKAATEGVGIITER